MISFILNLPYTLVGILTALLLVPKNLEWNKKPVALVFRVRNAWPLDMAKKGWRGATIGQAVLLNGREEAKDLAHELIHVEQNIRRPFIQPLLYKWELFRTGYRNNRYEVEAYSGSGSNYYGKEKVLTE